MSSIQVLKFGGTSVKTIGRIKHVAEIVAERCKTHKLIVVVSAMGDTTDYLLKLAQQCSEAPDARELDVLLSTGEQTSIALLTLILKGAGVKARSFTGPQIGIHTSDEYNNARIIDIKTDAIDAAFETFDVLVVAGFQGASPTGDVTTLGRGGSDTTAVALAAACNNADCDIYTDVDGVFDKDPNQFEDAQKFESISYDDVYEIVAAGAQVLHLRSVELAKRFGTKVRVRSTFNPNDHGTLLKPNSNVFKIKDVFELVPARVG